MSKILAASFFESSDTPAVARMLVGCYLCQALPQGEIRRHRLTEVEAYDGPQDKACHAHKGKTARTQVMFGPAGHFYIYLCYGMHWMLNIVTGPAAYPAAVLIRGAGEIRGPGRLTRHLAIDRSLNGKPAAVASGLWFEGPVSLPQNTEIQALPRIGIAYAGSEWAGKPYRFLLEARKLR